MNYGAGVGTGATGVAMIAGMTDGSLVCTVVAGIAAVAMVAGSVYRARHRRANQRP